jgi:hypothetical protein
LDSACSVALAPFSVRVLNMMTGRRGCRLLISFTAPRPSSRGISTSRVTTSGRRTSAFSMASSPSTAVPTTSISGSEARTLLMRRRSTAESSTTSARITCV